MLHENKDLYCETPVRRGTIEEPVPT